MEGLQNSGILPVPTTPRKSAVAHVSAGISIIAWSKNGIGAEMKMWIFVEMFSVKDMCPIREDGVM